MVIVFWNFLIAIFFIITEAEYYHNISTDAIISILVLYLEILNSQR